MPKAFNNWLRSFLRGTLFRAGLLTILVGLLLVSLPPLIVLSYDLSYAARPRVAITNVVLVLFDDTTLKELHSVNGEVSRGSHAQLLERLSRTEDKARLVFFDVVFDEPRQTDSDERFAEAIAKQGSVILTAQSNDTPMNSSTLERLNMPLPLFCRAAKGCGHAELYATFLGGTARRYVSWDCGETCYAGWVAATNLAPGVLSRASRNLDRWLAYYGPPGSQAIPSVPYEDVLATNGPSAIPAGFFKDKIVLVGERANSLGKIASKREAFTTPYSLFGYGPMSGVEIHATALLNLTRNEWIRLTPLPWQWFIAGLWGSAMVLVLYSLSGKGKTVLLLCAGAGALLLSMASIYLQWHTSYSWNWLGPSLGQTATALLLVVRAPKRDRYIAFISYRTEEDGAAALLISRSLADRGLRAFIDVRSLQAGKFDEQLLREIESATFFILLLSPNSLARCQNEGDWVLRELTHALAARKQIIPVFKSGFNFDAPQGIPDLPQIAQLKNYHGLAYSNSDFDGFMAKLMTLLKPR